MSNPVLYLCSSNLACPCRSYQLSLLSSSKWSIRLTTYTSLNQQKKKHKTTLSWVLAGFLSRDNALYLQVYTRIFTSHVCHSQHSAIKYFQDICIKKKKDFILLLFLFATWSSFIPCEYRCNEVLRSGRMRREPANIQNTLIIK